MGGRDGREEEGGEGGEEGERGGGGRKEGEECGTTNFERFY